MLSAGCTHRSTKPDAASADRPGMVADLMNMPQSARAYIPTPSPVPFLSPERQAEYASAFVQEHYSPWDRSEPVHDLETVRWPLREWGSGSVFGENTLPIPKENLEALAEYADFDRYPAVKLPGITVCESSLRALPTQKPVFFNFARAGEGFPFDYNQNTLVHAQTPLFISHASADGAWLHVETRNAFGWLPARHIALLDDGDIDAFRSAPLAAFVKDHVPVTGSYGRHRFTGRIGALVPVVGDGEASYDVLIVDRDETGRAVLLDAAVSKDHIAVMPLPATAEVVARLLDEVMGQAYGWGGLYGNRDCSALLVDIFTPLGIPLPRNSKQQAAAGRFLSLQDISPEAKERMIRTGAVPFATFLWHPGHIMLYLGQYEGRAAVAHAVWGVKTEKDGIEGRHVIGRTVITSLEPGKELPDISLPKGSRLLSLEGMTRLE